MVCIKSRPRVVELLRGAKKKTRCQDDYFRNIVPTTTAVVENEEKKKETDDRRMTRPILVYTLSDTEKGHPSRRESASKTGLTDELTTD